MEPTPSYRPVDIVKEMQEIVHKRVMTAFMFCVAQLEDDFGELWGEVDNEDDFDESKVTKEQQKVYELFMKWRKKIMDEGHKQIRLGKAQVVRQYSNIKGME